MSKSTKSLAALRRSYQRASLDEKSVSKDPIAQFEQWFEEALAAEALEANAMTLATVDRKGRPNARTVLLKGIKNGSFIFFTNYESEKGLELAKAPHAALVFFWPILERQVRIRGTVRRTTSAESREYFASRPRESQLGALASRQSEVVANREVLEKRFRRLERLHLGKELACPEYWGGFIVRPVSIEFWQGRPSRLHDRIRYFQKGKRWFRQRLSP